MGEFQFLPHQGRHEGSLLVIDDDEDVRILMGEILSKSGYASYLLRDGYEFFEFLKTQPASAPDCIVCDWRLVPRDPAKPRIDAPAILRMTEHYLPGTPVIVVSGFFQETDDIHHLMLHGARGFLSKPFLPSELVGKVRILVRMRNTIQRLNLWSSATALAGAGEAPAEREGAEVRKEAAGPPAEATPAPDAPRAEESGSSAGRQKVSDDGAAAGLPRRPPEPHPPGEAVDEEIAREYAVSFSDLVMEFENAVLELEHLYPEEGLRDFHSAFELAQSAYRALHTMKGNAGFIKADFSQRLIHSMEDALGCVRARPEVFDSKRVGRLVDLLLMGKDLLGGLCQYLQDHRTESGYESTSCYRKYLEVCGWIDALGEDLKSAEAAEPVTAEGLEEIF